MAESLLLGVDCGTSSTKAFLFDASGRIRAEGRSSLACRHPRPGWVEQEAQWWWDSFREAVAAVLKQGAGPAEIRGLAVTHQRMSYVPVDAAMKPLRPAILWNDLRCAAQNQRALELLDGDFIYRRTGYKPGLWTVYKVMWLKDNEPENYAKLWKVLLVQDYLLYRLTGELLTTASSAVTAGCLDVAAKNRWADDVLEAFGLSPSLFVQRILHGGELAGRVSEEAAGQTGLRAGLPVITAAGDQPCGVLGAGVARPHVASINGGTSCTIETCCQSLALDPAAGYFLEISPTADYLPENSAPSGGSSLMSWLKGLFGVETEWGEFYGLAEQAPAGSDGLMLVPYFSGANAPYWDLKARGVVAGLLLDHGRPHLVRAVIEGLAFESRRMIEAMERGTGSRVSEARLYGGSARSDTWNQIFADVLGVPVSTLETSETTALGAAICAAKGTGLYAGFAEALQNMVRVDRVYHPDPGRHELYTELFDQVYGKLYDQVSELIRNLSERTTKGDYRS